MAFIEEIVIDKMEVLEDESIQVRQATRIIREETGELVGQTYHRHVVLPGEDVANEHPRVQRLANAMHTPAAIAAFQAKQAANENSPL